MKKKQHREFGRQHHDSREEITVEFLPNARNAWLYIQAETIRLNTHTGLNYRLTPSHTSSPLRRISCLVDGCFVKDFSAMAPLPVPGRSVVRSALSSLSRRWDRSASFSIAVARTRGVRTSARHAIRSSPCVSPNPIMSTMSIARR